ncbi:MAG TPA: PepSY-like domain-containing protein [Bacteroidia bacterium]|jgi:hypothetical protein|nr:PepSY-like domain-containing protein [Bacteroidia bacterium]
MKKVIILLAFFAGTICVNAQKVNEADVPAAVKIEFKSLYPNIATVKWEKENGNYEANFSENKIETSATMDASGKLLETEQTIAIVSLPKGATDYLAKNLAGKKVKEASKIKDAAGKITYEAEVEGVDYTFDSDGKFIKSAKDND